MVARIRPTDEASKVHQHYVDAGWMATELQKLQDRGFIDFMHYLNRQKIASLVAEAQQLGFTPNITAHVAHSNMQCLSDLLRAEGHEEIDTAALTVVLLYEWEHQQGLADCGKCTSGKAGA